jgi:phenylpyruvate tautomerase PptA (4-oxalocrotonate tautomerase family)
MPIIDIELVCESETAFAKASAQALADAIGHALSSEPGRTWVRLRFLNRISYAENLSTLEFAELPAFVTVLQAHPPASDALAAEVMAVTKAVAQCLDRDPERVHVQYAPAASGRQAFGGKLVL